MDAAALARDWATIWQSEMAAMAADPETGLMLEALCVAWLDAAAQLDAATRAAGVPRAAGAARPDAAAGSAPAGAAAGARDGRPPHGEAWRNALPDAVAGDAAGGGPAA